MTKFCRNTFRGRVLPALLGAALAQTVVVAQNPAATATARLRIEKIAQTDWPAKVGVADIAPCMGSESRFGVFQSDGKPVAFQTLWSAPGEATRICFDTSSGSTAYEVCFGADLPGASGIWKPEAGVLLETRPCRNDLPINTAAEVTRVLSSAGTPLGRDYVPDVFLGANPFGPSTYYAALFNGWFTAPTAGQYTFATASDDASILEVDSRNVAAWLGVHGAGGGTHGEHQGTITLSAGLHRLSYVQVQLDGPSAAVAGWKPPGRDHVELMPASAFAPLARFRAEHFECAASSPERLYFEWHAVDQCALGGEMLVRAQFRVVDNGRGRSYRWRFDDGTEDAGANPRHFFPQPGLRQVTLEAWQKGVLAATNALRLRINPQWQQRDSWRDDVFEQAKSDFLRRDLARMPARDLIAVLEFADRADDAELLMGMGEGLMRRQEEFDGAAYAQTFYRVGEVFEHRGDSGDAQAGRAFRLALAPQRAVPAVSDRARVHLAALLIHCTGDLDEAGKVLGAISGGLLSKEEKRLWRLLEGDLLLARGKKEEARKEYAAAGETQADRQFNAERAARLEGAANLLEYGHLEEAQAALDRLELEMPLERMSLDTGLLALNLELGRKEFQRAFTDGQTLLAVAGDDPRQSDVLYTLVQTGLALGKKEQAQRAMGRLLKDFPYSEATAKAKDRWTEK
jgi:tetratricopeptide (TPR) repeat protein